MFFFLDTRAVFERFGLETFSLWFAPIVVLILFPLHNVFPMPTGHAEAQGFNSARCTHVLPCIDSRCRPIQQIPVRSR